MKIIVVEDEYCSHSQNVVDSLKIITKVEDNPAAHSLYEMDSMKVLEVEGEHYAHSQNEVDSMKIMMEI
jgi:hypothetical protein